MSFEAALIEKRGVEVAARARQHLDENEDRLHGMHDPSSGPSHLFLLVATHLQRNMRDFGIAPREEDTVQNRSHTVGRGVLGVSAEV